MALLCSAVDYVCAMRYVRARDRMNHHWYGTALGVLLVLLGSAGAGRASGAGDVSGWLYALVAGMGAALCYRAAGVAYHQGREHEIERLLSTLREARERESDAQGRGPRAHETVVVPPREDATPEVADLR